MINKCTVKGVTHFMPRPKPEVLLEYVDQSTYRSEQVVAAESVYAVFYDGQPINLKSQHTLLDYPGPRYKRVTFMNPGHAFNLAEKLNKLFKTNKFSVYELNSGTEISENQTDTR